MKSLRTVVMIGALVTLTTALPASASPPPSWQNARQAVLPKGAQGLPQGYLPTLSCVSPGTCEAGGAYSVGGGVQGVILNESNGKWTPPVSVKAPADVAKGSGVTIYGLSCGAIGNCAAVGSYNDRAGTVQSFVANEVRGKWSAATKVTLPVNGAKAGQNALLRSVACPSIGNCSAVGSYLDNDPAASRTVGFVVNEVRGRWLRAQEITTIATTNVNPFVAMNQIACASNANCAAVGSFVDRNDVTQALVVSEVGGVWHRGLSLALPLNASMYAGASVTEVTCVQQSSCTVLGTYNDAKGAIEGMSASANAGTWVRATELTMPANAGVNPRVFLYGYDGVACSSAGNCSVGGQYVDSTGHYQGFLASEASGTWSSAVALSLPTGGVSAGKNGGVIALSCPADGNCRAGAAYLDGSGAYQALVVSQVDGTWQTGQKVVLPGGARTVGVDGGLYALVCPSVTSCTGTGSYLSNATTYEGFTIAS
ncbi:MAG TPA: hypothetical protein VGZ68_11040 [Acidimicrobiales bacterium]|jgi:hypothetical protein|nr:hypothetical protein [Acidimicrobiales bacterium]